MMAVRDMVDTTTTTTTVAQAIPMTTAIKVDSMDAQTMATTMAVTMVAQTMITMVVTMAITITMGTATTTDGRIALHAPGHAHDLK